MSFVSHCSGTGETGSESKQVLRTQDEVKTRFLQNRESNDDIERAIPGKPQALRRG